MAVYEADFALPSEGLGRTCIARSGRLGLRSDGEDFVILLSSAFLVRWMIFCTGGWFALNIRGHEKQ